MEVPGDVGMQAKGSDGDRCVPGPRSGVFARPSPNVHGLRHLKASDPASGGRFWTFLLQIHTRRSELP